MILPGTSPQSKKSSENFVGAKTQVNNNKQRDQKRMDKGAKGIISCTWEVYKSPRTRVWEK